MIHPATNQSPMNPQPEVWIFDNKISIACVMYYLYDAFIIGDVDYLVLHKFLTSTDPDWDLICQQEWQSCWVLWGLRRQHSILP